MLTHLAPPDTAPSRVLILGRTGFIAKSLLRELERTGIATEAIGRPNLDLGAPASIDALTGVMRRSDTVVIAAALTPDKGRDFQTLMTNLRMAQHLCEVFRHCPCAHVIYLSSDAVYDGRQTPIDETSSREPVDLYALMHSGREMMLGSVLNANGVPYCVLRLCAIYGPGDTHNSYGPNRFVRMALDHRKIVLFGQGEEQRDHLYIRDIVRLISRVVRQRSTGVLNVTTGHAVSFMEVAQLVRRLIGQDVAIESQPRASAVTHRPFNPAALVASFPGYTFTPFGEALQETIALTLAGMA